MVFNFFCLTYFTLMSIKGTWYKGTLTAFARKHRINLVSEPELYMPL